MGAGRETGQRRPRHPLDREEGRDWNAPLEGKKYPGHLPEVIGPGPANGPCESHGECLYEGDHPLLREHPRRESQNGGRPSGIRGWKIGGHVQSRTSRREAPGFIFS